MINIKRIVCELFGRRWRWCDAYFDTVTLCRGSGQLARAACPATETVRLLKRDAPKELCSIHLPPPPPPPLPKWRVCKQTGREATPWCPEKETSYEEPRIACRVHLPPRNSAVPWMTLFSIYPHCKVDETDDELTEWAIRLGSAGVDFVRVFSCWREDPGFVMPFAHAEDGQRWDLDRVNPEYIRALQRFQRTLAKCGMGILFDFFPDQLNRTNYPFAPWAWTNNVNDIRGIYDTRPHAIARFCSWIWTIFDIIGIEGNMMKFGNEMNVSTDINEIKRWCERWIDSIARYARSIGVQGPLHCSQEPFPGTGQKISNYLGDADWGLGWPWDQIICHIHMGTIEGWEHYWNPPDGRRWSVLKHYAISDDGIGFGDHNEVPPEQRGVCSSGREWYGSWVGSKCSGNVPYRIAWVRVFSDLFQERLRMIEFMPQRLHNEVYRLNDIDQEIDVNVYWKAALELWGVDIRRDF